MPKFQQVSGKLIHKSPFLPRVVFDTGATFDETLSLRPVGSEDESHDIDIPSNFTNGDLQETNYVEVYHGEFE